MELERLGAFEVAVHVNLDTALRVVYLGSVPALLLGVVFEALDEDDTVRRGVAQAFVGVLGVVRDLAVLVVRIGQPVDLGGIGAVGGLAAYEIISGNEFSIQNGYLEAKLLLESNPRPTAIFALSNTILLGSIKAIREAGLRIPEDISIISFDNNKYLDYMVPPINRVSQPVEDMAKLASRILFEKINGEKPEQVTRLSLSPVLMNGSSVGICRQEVT